MPDTSPMNDKGRLEAIFDAALTRSAGGRDAVIVEQCAGDDELLGKLRKLLAAHEAAGDGFLENELVLSAEIEDRIASLKPEEAGDRIGPYKLLEQIGEGGFGTVWMAEQEQPVRRRVALKIIKLGMNTKEVIARFEQERQALAMMDHPNIAKVFDAGATQWGRPYFVMELVRGKRITEFCDEADMPTRERLELFIQVCQAVQHAHQKGIIHRDIKPSNILVAVHDDAPVPKVIDFGVAKATQQPLTDKTLFTRFEQMVGTPLYMSPEQADGGLDIDTRADTYALGVLLYELLTGRTPFDPEALMQAGFEEMRRVIREDEPRKPSTVLSTMEKGVLTTVARHRHSEPPKLISAVRGDLDWIVMKALEKDRRRRYATTSDLAADLERHLRDEPVSAGPPSVSYRFEKLIRRQKGPLAAAAALLLTLLAGTMVSIWQAKVATDARDDSDRARKRSDERLWQSRLSEVRALRKETAAGRRSKALEVIRQAALYQPSIELRNEAIHCLARPDFEPAERWPATVNHPDIKAAQVDDQFTIRAQLLMPRPDPDISRDGHSLTTAPEGLVREVMLSSLKDGSELARFRCPNQDFVLSPDGRWLLIGAASNSSTHFSIWDWREKREVLTEKAIPDADVRGLYSNWRRPGIFSADGRWFGVLIGNEKAERKQRRFADIALFEPASLKERDRDPNRSATFTVFDLHVGGREASRWKTEANIMDIAFSPDGGRVAIGEQPVTGTQFCRVFKIGAPDTEQPLLIKHRALEIAWSPDSRRIAMACVDGKVRIWDISGTPKETAAFAAHYWSPSRIAWSADGRFLATASGTDRIVRLWDAHTTDLLSEAPVAESIAEADLKFVGDDSRLGPVLFGDEVGFLKIQGDILRLRPAGHSVQTASGGAYGFGGRLVATGGGDGVRLWNRDGKMLHHMYLSSASGGQVGSVYFTPDGVIATAVMGLLKWKITIEGEQATVGAMEVLRPRAVSGSSLNPRGDRLAVTYNSATSKVATIFDLTGGTPDRDFEAPHSTNGTIAFSPDERWLAVGDWSQSEPIVVFDVQSGKLAAKLQIESGSTTAANSSTRVVKAWFSADSRTLFTLSDRALARWEAGTWRKLSERTGDGLPDSMMVDSTEKLAMAWDKESRQLRLLDADSLAELASLGFGKNYALAISPDNSQILACDDQNRIQFWNLAALRGELSRLGLDWPGVPIRPVTNASVGSVVAVAQNAVPQSDTNAEGGRSRGE